MTFRGDADHSSERNEDAESRFAEALPADVLAIGEPRVSVRRTDGGLAVRLTVEERVRPARAVRLVKTDYESGGTRRVTVGLFPGIPQQLYEDDDNENAAQSTFFFPDDFRSSCNGLFVYPLSYVGVNVCCVGLPTVFSLFGAGETGGLVGWNLWRTKEEERRIIGTEEERLVRFAASETSRGAFGGPVLATVFVPELALRRTIALRRNADGTANEGVCPLPADAPRDVAGIVLLSFPERTSRYGDKAEALGAGPFPFPREAAASVSAAAARPPDVVDSVADPETPGGTLFFGAAPAEAVREAVRGGRPAAAAAPDGTVLSFRESRLAPGTAAFDVSVARTGKRAEAAANRNRLLESLERFRALEDEYGAEAGDLGGEAWREARKALEGAAARFARNPAADFGRERIGRALDGAGAALSSRSTLDAARTALASIRRASARWAPDFGSGGDAAEELCVRLEAVRTAAPADLARARRAAKEALDGVERRLAGELDRRLDRRIADRPAARTVAVPAFPRRFAAEEPGDGEAVLDVLFAADASVRERRLADVPPAVAAFAAASDPSASVRRAAIGCGAADDDLLELLARGDGDESVRLSALGAMRDARTRATVACGDPDENFRRKAIPAACGTESLAAAARSGADESFRLAAIALLDDEDALGAIARTDVSSAIRLAATKRIRDSAALAEIAKCDADETVRLVATQRVSDPAVLGIIAENDASEAVRRTAREKLGESRNPRPER